MATTQIAAPFRLPAVDDYLAFVRSSASPILGILERLDDRSKDAAWAEIETKLMAFNTPNGWEGPNELLLTIGQRLRDLPPEWTTIRGRPDEHRACKQARPGKVRAASSFTGFASFGRDDK